MPAKITAKAKRVAIAEMASGSGARPEATCTQ
jgi:hypothetical protein